MLAGLTALLGGGGGGGGSFESIQTFTASGNPADFTFTSIPSTYKHLQIRSISKDSYTTGTASFTQLTMLFNSDYGNNYSYHILSGNGTSASASGVANIYNIGSAFGSIYGSISSTYSASIVDILDYASTTKYKTIRGFTGADLNSGTTTSVVQLGSGSWRSTSAISSITVQASSSGFVAGTTFALYGIKG